MADRLLFLSGPLAGIAHAVDDTAFVGRQVGSRDAADLRGGGQSAALLPPVVRADRRLRSEAVRLAARRRRGGRSRPPAEGAVSQLPFFPGTSGHLLCGVDRLRVIAQWLVPRAGPR